MVNAAFKSLSDKMENIGYVTSEGFTSDDGTHFDTKSVRIFAERYAEKYLEMTGEKR